eukprot:IDg18683t1
MRRAMAGQHRCRAPTLALAGLRVTPLSSWRCLFSPSTQRLISLCTSSRVSRLSCVDAGVSQTPSERTLQFDDRSMNQPAALCFRLSASIVSVFEPLFEASSQPPASPSRFSLSVFLHPALHRCKRPLSTVASFWREKLLIRETACIGDT